MRGEVHILVYCPIDTFQWGSTHSALYKQRKMCKPLKAVQFIERCNSYTVTPFLSVFFQKDEVAGA